METKTLLPIIGTLKASFRFNVYIKNRVRRLDIVSYNTSGNVKRDYKSMIRKAHHTAVIIVADTVGGSYKYKSFLQDYTFRYNDFVSKGKKGTYLSMSNYNNEIPENDKVTVTRKQEQRRLQSLRASRGIEIIRGKKSEKGNKTVKPKIKHVKKKTKKLGKTKSVSRREKLTRSKNTRLRNTKKALRIVR